MNNRLSYWILLLLMFFSHSVDAQWIESNNGIYGGTITALAKYSGNVFAGTWGGIYHSTDNALSWKQLNTGLDNTFINAMTVSARGTVFVATDGGSRMFVSSAPFSQWTVANLGLPYNPVTELTSISNQVFGLTENGLLLTCSDENTTWTPVQTVPGLVNSISASGENLFAATDNGIYLSVDRGLTWTAKSNGLIDKSIYTISTVNKYVLAKARAGVTFFSDDTGSSWSLVTLDGFSFKLAEGNDRLYAVSETEAYFTTDEGKNWDIVWGLPGAKDLIVSGTRQIAGTPYGVYTSVNSAPWSASNFSGLTNARIIGFAAAPDHVFCATASGDVLRSDDIGKTWTSVSRGLPFNKITAIGYFDNILLVAKSAYGIYRSENDGRSWSLAAGGVADITSFVKHKNHLVAGGRSGIYFSSDKGHSWSRLNNSPQSVQYLKLLDQRDTLYVVSPDHGISYSADAGLTWTSINDGLQLSTARPTSITAFNGLTFAGLESQDPVYVRDNIYSAWKSASEGLNNVSVTASFATDGHNLFASGDKGIFISRTGAEWSPLQNEQLPIFSSPLGVESLFIHRNHLFAGTEAFGVWVSCIEPPRPTVSLVSSTPYDATLVSDSPEGNQWFLNGTPIPGATQTTYKPAVSGKYAVKLLLNDCESGLSEEVNVFIEEFPDAQIIMPNVFTPNEDAFNPLFVPIQYDHVSTAEILIMDRWGKELFRSADLAAGWNGGSAQAGVYYYQITYTGKNGKQGQLKGWVHLIR